MSQKAYNSPLIFMKLYVCHTCAFISTIFKFTFGLAPIAVGLNSQRVAVLLVCRLGRLPWDYYFIINNIRVRVYARMYVYYNKIQNWTCFLTYLIRFFSHLLFYFTFVYIGYGIRSAHSQDGVFSLKHFLHI